MCNFGRGHHEVHFCEIILDLDQWLRCRLKDFLSGALADLLFGEAEPLAGIIGNNPVIFFLIILNLNQWFRRECHSTKKFTDRRTPGEE